MQAQLAADAQCDESISQCKHITKYGKRSLGQQHSAHCRNGTAEAMRKTERGRFRIEANGGRVNRAMAEHVEAADRPTAPASSPGGDLAEPSTAHRGFLGRGASEGAQRGLDGALGPSRPHPRDGGAPDRSEFVSRTVHAGVSGAMGVPAAEAHPAAAPAGDNPENSMEDNVEQHDVTNDVEMDFVGCIGASLGIGSLEPSFDDGISAMLLAETGRSGRVRRRDGRQALRTLVSE